MTGYIQEEESEGELQGGQAKRRQGGRKDERWILKEKTLCFEANGIQNIIPAVHVCSKKLVDYYSWTRL